MIYQHPLSREFFLTSGLRLSARLVGLKQNEKIFLESVASETPQYNNSDL